MCGRIPPKLQSIIKVAGEISGVKSNQWADVFDRRAVGEGRSRGGVCPSSALWGN